MKKRHEQCETEQKKQTKKQLLRLTSCQTKLLCRQSTPGLHWILAPKRTSQKKANRLSTTIDRKIRHGLIRCVLVISRDHSWLQSFSSCLRVSSASWRSQRQSWGSWSRETRICPSQYFTISNMPQICILRSRPTANSQVPTCTPQAEATITLQECQSLEDQVMTLVKPFERNSWRMDWSGMCTKIKVTHSTCQGNALYVWRMTYIYTFTVLNWRLGSSTLARHTPKHMPETYPEAGRPAKHTPETNSPVQERHSKTHPHEG